MSTLILLFYYFLFSSKINKLLYMGNKKAKDLTKEEWIMKQLRRISGMWPAKNEALNRAKEKVQIGFYKNGNPEYKVMYKCYICQQVHPRENTQVDHVIPVIAIEGFNDWNEYIDSLFCSVDNLKAVCKQCHKQKSKEEAAKRKVARSIQSKK